MPIFFRHDQNQITLVGQTYPLREAIKALGGRFNYERKTWSLPFSDEMRNEVERLCAKTGGGIMEGADGGADPALRLATPEKFQQLFGATQEATPTVEPLAPLFSKRLSERPQLRGGGERAAQFSRLNEQCSDEDNEADETFLTASRVEPPEVWSIGQLVGRIHQTIEQAFPSPIWVVGEIQNIGRKRQAVFLQLAEPTGDANEGASMSVSATIWSQALKAIERKRGAQLVTDVMQDGLQIRCLCQVGLYKGRGQISLTIIDIDPDFTQGLLALARERLLRELRAAGLDRANKILPMPAVPLCIGLVTAEGSRAVGDFCHQLFQVGRYPGKVLFAPAAMQGERVPREVPAALNTLATAGCDLIVLTRGGGSTADLRWFDTREVAYGVASCPLPVIAAIGHHDDVCVAEEVACEHRKTPTAAADFVSERIAAVRERLQEYQWQMERRLQDGWRRQTERTQNLSSRLSSQSLLALEKWLRWLQERSGRLAQGAERNLAHKNEQLIRLGAQLETADPKAQMQRGWTRLWGPRGQIRTSEDVTVGDQLQALLEDAQLALRVEEVKRS